MKTMVLYSFALSVLMMLGGCVSPLEVTLKDATEEALSETVFPAPTYEMKRLRSAYIASAVGLYGVHAVRRYSGEDAQDDAQAILTRFEDTVAALTKMSKETYNKEFARADYVLGKAFRLVKVAAEPTKRYYRERVWQFILNRDPVAAAKTAFEALKGLSEVEYYRSALTNDARGFAIDVARGESTPWNPTQVNNSWEDRVCPEQTGGGSSDVHSRSAKKRAQKNQLGIPWKLFLSEDLRERMCDEKKPVLDGEWLMIRKALAAGADDGTVSSMNVEPDHWKFPNELIQIACKRLARFAGKDDPKAYCKNVKVT